MNCHEKIKQPKPEKEEPKNIECDEGACDDCRWNETDCVGDSHCFSPKEEPKPERIEELKEISYTELERKTPIGETLLIVDKINECVRAVNEMRGEK